MADEQTEIPAIKVKIDTFASEQLRQRDAVHELRGNSTALLAARERHEAAITKLDGQVADLNAQALRHDDAIRHAGEGHNDLRVSLRAVETKVDGISRVVPAIDRLIALIPAIETLQRLVPSLESLAAERQVMRDEFRLKTRSNWIAWAGLILAMAAFGRALPIHLTLSQ